MDKESSVSYAITVLRSTQEVYDFWSDPDNLARCSRHLIHAERLDPQRTRWETEGPFGTVKWVARAVEDQPEDCIAWTTEPGSDSDIAIEGRVTFRPAPKNRGTEVTVTAVVHPPAGPLGEAIAKLTGHAPKQEIADALRRIKAILECGELPRVEGQPSSILRDDPQTPEESRKVGLR